MNAARRCRWPRLQHLLLRLAFLLCLSASLTTALNRREEPSRKGGILKAIEVPSSSRSSNPFAASSYLSVSSSSSPIVSKPHLFSVEELFNQVAEQHWQPLEVLLQRGASRGALAKVAFQQQQKEAFADAHAAAKQVVEACEADQETDACKNAKAEALVSSSPKTRHSLQIGVFKETNASDSTSSNSSSNSSSSSSINDSSSSMVQVEGVFGSVWDNLFGGAGAGNAENFQGGNQGSYFNFMYPSDNDYPWACVCDEAQYKQWVNKQVQYVACRNQVDLSTQNVVAMCNPENHTINAAFGGPWGSASAAASVGALAAAVALSTALL